MPPKKGRLIWLDMEMTGLDANQDRIIEIATIVTNDDLETISEGPVIAVHQSDEILAGMDNWNQKQHHQSGLVERVKASDYNEAQAEQETLDFLKEYVRAGVSPLCGNSVYQDKRFLYRYMPQLAAYFHYRLIDVSTIKELMKRWAPIVYKNLPKKESKHLALDDIRDSIEECRYYRQFFKTE